MAMLRNLRNMIKAGMSSKHISWVVKKLTDERSVTQSKQFPFRFFSAYQVLEEMEDELTKAESELLDIKSVKSLYFITTTNFQLHCRCLIKIIHFLQV